MSEALIQSFWAVVALATGYGVGWLHGHFMDPSSLHKQKAMKRKNAQRRLREIWFERHPGCLTIEETFRVPDPWTWFNIYANLMNHNQTIQTVSLAFVETFERRAKEKKQLEAVILRQRQELKKRLAELDKLKEKLADSGVSAPREEK